MPPLELKPPSEKRPRVTVLQSFHCVLVSLPATLAMALVTRPLRLVGRRLPLLVLLLPAYV